MNKLKDWLAVIASIIALTTAIVTTTLGYSSLDKRISLNSEHTSTCQQELGELTRIKANQKEVVLSLLIMKSELETKEILKFSSSVDKAIEMLSQPSN